MNKNTLQIPIFIFLMLLTITGYNQQTENIQVKQLNNKISIVYDLTHERIGQLFHVKAYYSMDGGETFEGPLDSIKGDYGEGIKGGTNKVFVWDVLSEVPHLNSENVVFKVVAQPTGIEYPTDHTSDFNFELKRCQLKKDKVEVVISIINTGKKKDLRIPNRLARLYNYSDQRLEAKSSIHGTKAAKQRHSQPQVTLHKGQSIVSRFKFNLPNQKRDRVKLFQLGFDILDITHGIDVTPAKIEFRDFPIFSKQEKTRREAVSQPKAFAIGKKMEQPEDQLPPEIIVHSPKLSKEDPPLISKQRVQVNGSVRDTSGIFELRVNNKATDIDAEGNFQAMVSLREGFNEVILHATDIRENSTEQKYMILHLPEDEQTKEKLREVAKEEAENTQEVRAGKYHALVIGENEYNDPLITDLDNPIDDAQQLYNILHSEYAFNKNNITFLKNPTRSDIMVELDNLNSELNENDNLLIFYAGHGYWDSENKVGYWLPSDAKSENTANWFRNSTLREYIHSLDTKHTMVIADACFGGSIFKTRKAFANASQTIKNLYKLPSRKAMTSGNLKEVPDESVFMKYLVKRLKENQKQYITAEELFNSLKIAVINNSPNEPQYGEIKNSGDEGGDFIFVKQTSSN